MPPFRKIGLGLALVGTFAASVLDFPLQDAVEPAPAHATVSPTTSSPAVVETAVQQPEGLLREPFAAQPANLFAARNWLPPAPRLAPVKPETPRAPPLPFKYLGKMIDGNEVVAFVGQGTSTHLLRKGAVVGGYKVEDVSQADITLVYLPLNETQRLTFGSSN
jgi:hypothetical protein